MKKLFIYICILILALSMFSCNKEETLPSSEDSSELKLPVMVSIVPQRYFMEHVGGDKVNITVFIPPGSSPHTYEPKPDNIKEISKVKAYFTVGAEFEQSWLDKIKGVNENMEIINTAEGVEFITVADGETEHSGLDTHIWISPKLVKIQSHNIYKGLSKADPENEPYYKENLENFYKEIDELDKYIRDTLEGIENRKFMIFHPSWGYFAKDYDLEMLPVEIEGKEPSASELAELIDKAKENNIKIIFVSPFFSTKTAKVIAGEIGGDTLFISTLEEDWEENLKKVANIFAKVMKQENIKENE